MAASTTAQSGLPAVLNPAGPFAEPVSTLSWVLFAGGAVVTLIVIVALILAIWGKERWQKRLGSERMVLAGGLALPAVVLTALLIWGLATTAHLIRPAEDPMRVAIVGEQWWWRVQYQDIHVAEANELHIPVGRTVRLELTGADVIHSFWIPQLAGKLDMIPGRTNILQIRADRPGVYRGQCAEYCGGAHALMAFVVVAHEPAEFERWVAARLRPAPAPVAPVAQRGQQLFLTGPCAFCHTIRGTEAGGRAGPDLTHVGSRRSLAAGALPNNLGGYTAWIAGNQSIKPMNRMGEFHQYQRGDLIALATYLEGLK